MADAARHEAVLFDLGGVVFDVDSDRLLHYVAQTLGKTFEDVERVIYDPKLLLPFELGTISPQAYYEGLRERLGLGWPYEQFVRMWNGLFTPKPDVVNLIGRLSRGYKLLALTNTNDLHIRYIRQSFPALGVFHDWIASSDVGMRKPMPEIYALALQRAGTKPERAIYIDDRPELVEAGRRAGLHAIRFESGSQLEEELKRLGVAV